MQLSAVANTTGLLINALPQSVTNGATTLGTLQADRLPKFLPGPTTCGFPWGNRTVFNTDPSDFPNTGVTRYYDWELSVGTVAPDGVVLNNTLLVNGAYPGPLIEANWGDWIEVKVTNKLCCEGTSMHWHGLLQKETPWFDGVPGVTQCPIAPNGTFTYRFRADTYGTSWWHSHYSAQYTAAAQGPMIIHGPINPDFDYDVDLGPIMLSDWFHLDYYTMVNITMLPNGFGSAGFFSADSILINGKMNYDCSLTNLTCTPNAGVSKFQFESGKKYRLRLINSGAEPIHKFSIDGHTLTVIAIDFVPIKPYTTNVVTLVVGQRTDVVVEATGKVGDVFWMRSATTAFCSDVPGNLTGLAGVYYEGASTDTLPLTNTSMTDDQLMLCDNDDIGLSIPEYAMAVPEPSLTIEIHCKLWNNGTHNVWYMNNVSFIDDYNSPNLLMAKLGNISFPRVENVFNFGSNTSVRMIVYNHMALASHPMHIHGHNFYILDSGAGTWNGTTNSTINPLNPQRRDTPNVRKAVAINSTAAENDYQGIPSYVVVQFDMDNPGVWPFHCHIAWHVSDGFVMMILERPDDIKNDMEIPGIMAQTCRDWSAWTGDHVVDQIDSGL